MPKAPPVTTTDEKLDLIVEHLRRMDRRDKLRTWGAFVKGLLGLIPLIAFVGGLWYFYYHGDEMLSKIAAEAAKQAAEVTKDNAGDFMKQFEQYMPKKQ